MPFYKTLVNRQTVIVADGKTYKFDLGGSCVEENCGLSPDLIGGVQRVSIISLLSSRGRAEIGLSYSDDTKIKSVEHFKSYALKDYMSAPQVMTFIQQQGGYLMILNRKGAVDGVKFSQTFFIYPCMDDGSNGTRLENIISSIEKTLVKG